MRSRNLPVLGIDELTCFDCIFLQEQVKEMQDQLDLLKQTVTVLTLQVSAMKQDLFGDGVLVPFDRNGDFCPAGR
jgi:hypothetical protein